MSQPPPLFTDAHLANWLGFDVDATRATVVEEVVWGWLRPALQATDRPNPVPAELFSSALELAAIAHENPAGLSSKQFGDVAEQYSAEARDRILARVATDAGVRPASAPRGRFPAAQRYPDPAW